MTDCPVNISLQKLTTEVQFHKDIFLEVKGCYSRVEWLSHVLPVPEDGVHGGAPRDVAGQAGRPARQEGHLRGLHIAARAACGVWRRW